MNAKIALITGGFTGEAEVSLKSAAFVAQKLDTKRFDVYKIILTKHSWHYIDESGIEHEIDRKNFTLSLPDKVIAFDLAFIMLHGSPGEDGKLQGYLDMVGLKYTSCDTLTSALTMNKAYTKLLLQDVKNLHLAKSICLLDNNKEGQFAIFAQLKLPYFVKPNGGGSSIGMTKVNKREELVTALERAFNTENANKQVLIEEFVTGREFSIGVYRSSKGLEVLPATEVITSREFFDFEAKYTPGLTEEITPADLTSEEQERIKGIVKDVYVTLNCKGLVRIDFFLEKDSNKFYFIEINTIPGQTEQSFIPQQVRATGMNETDFYSELITQALIDNK
ncbi:D-alanine--D-alanine ligase [Olivibacter domesticus]|uniref:D-alanine--D-alanine ligase n=1 Tax=Olivibacter domesticus TaxID=407022 RepID=A0A1H7PPJ2_OLID1|nr:D-alanine--D-alanine ligase [Olivibacter domesticus]SEL37324.1 D-alanine-D-alanine ligase [Olivibacter domesticus]